MKKISYAALAAFATIYGGSPTHSMTSSVCDFDKPTGKCIGEIQFQRTGGSSKSYHADILVSSSSPTCSKVEYYLDHTPYETVLANKSSDHESLFGTKPITPDSVKVFKCTSYAPLSSTKGHSSETTQAGSDAFEGHWSGSVHWFLVSSGAELDVRVSGNQASGNWIDGKSGIDTPFTGTISGNTLSFNFVAAQDGTPSTGKLVLDGPNSATFSTNGGGISFSGKVHK